MIRFFVAFAYSFYCIIYLGNFFFLRSCDSFLFFCFLIYFFYIISFLYTLQLLSFNLIDSFLASSCIFIIRKERGTDERTWPNNLHLNVNMVLSIFDTIYDIYAMCNVKETGNWNFCASLRCFQSNDKRPNIKWMS